MTLQCPRCKYVDDRMEINFCQKCKTPMSNTGRRLLTSRQSSLPAVVNRSGLTVQNQSLELAVHTDLKRLYLDLYQSIEALKRGNPFWEMAGKDLTAYRIERRLEQKFEELAEQKSQAFLRMHEQLFEAEIARQKSHYEAAILHEKLQKKIDIAFAAQAQILGKALNEESFAALPEDAQAEFIIRLVERVMDEIFASTSPNINNATLPDPYSRQNTIIINPDEF